MLERIRNRLTVLLTILLPMSASAAEIQIVSSQPPSPPWTFQLQRADAPVPCRAGEHPPKCVTNSLVIENQSGRILECQAEIRYDGLNSEGFPNMVKPAVLMPRESRVVLSERALPEVAVASHNVTCNARALDTSRLTRSCKSNLDTSKVDLAATYPPTSRRAAEEGPVILEFSLTREAGPPKDVVVAGSSLFPRLDQAAVEAISRATGSTDCEVGRFMFKLDFKLHE
ncbi:TonB family protein [Steroidobacter cummioxidans]|uniref:TonB family protein n=1 Tax=Steroidobacter cummioxidans TaxID=1803913 RepID=UPI000E30EB1B|nr:TonB family protein [Steroidobacter cummioxidans]